MNKTVSNLDANAPASERRKPRIMVAGEFSAGKSRLINGLLGREVLPSNVTSTALPPIWLVGDGSESLIVGTDGSTAEFDMEEIDIEATAFCVLSAEAEILKHVDLIDTPGNSDPNIPAECWERMVEYADGMIWCTSAMQAWKQTEKATVSDLPEDLRDNALLLITQADRMQDEKSAGKVKRRVNRDAGKFFAEVKMGSMLNDEDVAEIVDWLKGVAAEMPVRGKEEAIVDGLRPDAGVRPVSVPAEPAAVEASTPEDEKPAIVLEKTVEAQMAEFAAVSEDDASEPVDPPAEDAGVADEVEEKVAASEPKSKSPANDDDIDPAIKAVMDSFAKADPLAELDDLDDGAAGGDSMGLPNGTIADTWNAMTNGSDLADNEVYLERVEALLVEVKSLLSRGKADVSSDVESV